MAGYGFDTLDHELESGGITVRYFYALRTSLDLVDIIARLDAVGKVTVENKFELSVFFDLDTRNVLIAVVVLSILSLLITSIPATPS